MAKLSYKQTLQQKLTPRQILQASILQLNLPLLEQRILKELEHNPALEIIDDSESLLDEEVTVDEIDNSDDEEIDFDWEELIGEHEEFENPPLRSFDEEMPETPLVSKESFVDMYTRQLEDTNATEKELLIAEQVLGNLDSQGYLTIDPHLISDRLDIEVDGVINIMYKIQRLDPPGVASRNMQECLFAQAEYRNENKLAIIILRDFFDDIANHRYEKIIKSLKCSKAHFNEAMEFISKLNPSPRDDQLALDKDIIIPDIAVEDKGGKYHVIINETSLPNLRVNSSYLKMLNTHKKERDVLKFIKDKIESANWFVEAIKDRKKTITKVMESIIKKQSNYFYKSDRVLEPMILKDIASDLNLDISTISRVTNGKYVQLPWGIKELKSFFSEAVRTQSGEEISNTQVRNRLEEIISQENKNNPMNDQELTEKLFAEGYKIARRTVTKYREQAKIPTARLRRKI